MQPSARADAYLDSPFVSMMAQQEPIFFTSQGTSLHGLAHGLADIRHGTQQRAWAMVYPPIPMEAINRGLPLWVEKWRSNKLIQLDKKSVSECTWDRWGLRVKNSIVIFPHSDILAVFSHGCRLKPNHVKPFCVISVVSSFLCSVWLDWCPKHNKQRSSTLVAVYCAKVA